MLHCCSGAKQLCCLGQQATALYVFYLQWNLYEPRVTSTWMSPSVLVLFWRHLISVHGTHSLKVGHTMSCMHFKGNLGPLEGPECGDRNNRQICLTNLRNCELGTLAESSVHWNFAIFLVQWLNTFLLYDSKCRTLSKQPATLFIIFEQYGKLKW